MAIAFGHWVDSILDGPVVVEVGGQSFNIPRDAQTKRVQAGKNEFLHILYNGKVRVLSALGMLSESDAHATTRATPANWRLVGG